MLFRLQPYDAIAYNNRGLAYTNLSDYQSAIEDYKQAIRLKPDYADAYNNRGSVYLNQGNNELGCRDGEKACALGDCKLLKIAKDIVADFITFNIHDTLVLCFHNENKTYFSRLDIGNYFFDSCELHRTS